MLKFSSFLPAFSAAESHRGFNPRPAHVSAGLSGLRYFGATGPRAPPPTRFRLDPPAVRRPRLPSRSSSVRRSSKTFAPRAASTCSLSFVSLSIDMDFRLSIGITVNYLTVRHAYESDSRKSIPIFDLYRRFQEKKPEGNNAACATAFQSERNIANKIARGGFTAGYRLSTRSKSAAEKTGDLGRFPSFGRDRALSLLRRDGAATRLRLRVTMPSAARAITWRQFNSGSNQGHAANATAAGIFRH